MPDTKPIFKNQGLCDGLLHWEWTDGFAYNGFSSPGGQLSFTMMNTELRKTKHVECWIPGVTLMIVIGNLIMAGPVDKTVT